MAKWETATEEEVEIIKKQGLDPAHCAVAHPGEDQLVILNWLDHRVDKRELYIRIPPRCGKSQTIKKIKELLGG